MNKIHIKECNTCFKNIKWKHEIETINIQSKIILQNHYSKQDVKKSHPKRNKYTCQINEMDLDTKMHFKSRQWVQYAKHFSVFIKENKLSYPCSNWVIKIYLNRKCL